MDHTAILSALDEGPASTSELAARCDVPEREMFELLFRCGRSLGLTGEIQGDESVVWRTDRAAGVANRPPIPVEFAFAQLS